MGFELTFIQVFVCGIAFFGAGMIDSISGGGGLITIPVMLALGIPTHLITGTNLASAWVGTGVAAGKFIKSKNVHWKSALITLPFAVVSSSLGAKLNLLMPDQYLRIFMIAAIPCIAVFLLFNKKFGECDLAAEQPNRKIVIWSVLSGIVLGAYMGFYGPGAGLFFMLSYAAFLKMNMVRANGTSRFVIAIAMIASVITYALSGAVIWKLVIVATVFNVAGSYIGASLAIKKGIRIIRPVMFIVLALLIIKIIFG